MSADGRPALLGLGQTRKLSRAAQEALARMDEEDRARQAPPPPEPAPAPQWATRRVLQWTRFEEVPDEAFEEASIREKILLVAWGRFSGQSFEAWEMCLAAWERFPQDFGLGPSRKHPDSNKVMPKFYELHARRGWLVAVGKQRYRMSELGERAVRDLLLAMQEQLQGR